MIAQEKTNRVLELLAAGELSNRKIAQAVGVSSRWVDRVAKGDFTECERETEDERPPTVSRSAERRRCPCGALVYGECVACKIRATQAKEGEASA